jgi:uncharacterized protein YndB with AHSA1/START domain
MDIAADEATRLEVRRHYKAGIAAVYAACTDPEQMKRWMAPAGAVRESEVTLDVRVGGRYRIVMHSPDGETHRVSGEYREVVPPHRLVYTWAWESTPERLSLVTIELRAAGDGTELVLTHQRLADRAARDRHLEGWKTCLDMLGNLISR